MHYVKKASEVSGAFTDIGNQYNPLFYTIYIAVPAFWRNGFFQFLAGYLAMTFMLPFIDNCPRKRALEVK
jgi:hypothetical protein